MALGYRGQRGLAPDTQPVAFGYISDVHYADRDPSAFYFRDGALKLGTALATFASESVEFAILNGDMIDHAAGEADAATDLAVIEAAYAEATMPRYYSLGNHDMDALSKSQFIAGIGMTTAYYSFDAGDGVFRPRVRFIVLDACYRSDSDDDPYDSGNFDSANSFVPPAQRAWLAAQLATDRRCVVVCHQRLDDAGGDIHTVNNAAVVRGILEAAGNVVGVLSAHAHVNAKATVEGVDYFVSNDATSGAHPLNAYAVVRVFPGGLDVTGYGGQTTYSL